jgi:hypothetical protein
MTDDALCPICADGLPAPVICTRCTNRIRRDLDTVGRLRHQLDPTPGRTGSNGRAPGKPGSKPPANLTVIAMSDIRSRIRIGDDGTHDPDDVANVDADLLTEARWVIEERDLHPPMRDAFDSLRVLNIHFDWIVRHPRADEFAAVIEGCARGLRGVLRDWPDAAVGTCPATHPTRDTCGGPLRLDYRGPLALDPDAQVKPTHVVCGWCDGAWPMDPASLIGMLRVVKPRSFPVARAWACEALGIDPATLRQWIRRGHVTSYSDEQVNLVELLARCDTPGIA